MNKILISVFCMAVATSALAQKPKSTPVPTRLHCAVMTKATVDIAAATKAKMFADYKGRRYFFCCAGCPGAFKANPAKYVKSDSIPTPKTKSKAKTKLKPQIARAGSAG